MPWYQRGRPTYARAPKEMLEKGEPSLGGGGGGSSAPELARVCEAGK